MQKYLESLSLKFKVGNYCLDSLHNILLNAYTLPKTYLLSACMAEFNGIMLNIDSCLDILSHIIEIHYHCGLSHDKIDFPLLLREIKKGSLINDQSVINALEKLEGDFQYVHDYCNTIKHRQVVFFFDQYILTMLGVVPRLVWFDGFQCGNRSYRAGEPLTIAERYDALLKQSFCDLFILAGIDFSKVV